MECKTVARRAELTAGRLHLTFLRGEDRFEHHLRRGDLPARLLWSEEGDASQPWPASPPFQEAMTHGDAVLLVGMAGHGHWSGSIEARNGGFVFDIACRSPRRPVALGSVYRMPDAELLEVTEQRARLCLTDDTQLVIEALPVDGETATRVSSGGDRIVIAPAIPERAYPYTIRWKYTLTSLLSAGPGPEESG